MLRIFLEDEKHLFYMKSDLNYHSTPFYSLFYNNYIEKMNFFCERNPKLGRHYYDLINSLLSREGKKRANRKDFYKHQLFVEFGVSFECD